MGLLKKWSFCFWKVPKNIFDSTPCFSFSCCQLFPYIFSCMIQKHFSMFPISLLKNILFLNLFVSVQKKKESPPKKKKLDSLDFFSWLFLLNLFSFFFFVSSLFVYSPCCYSSYSFFSPCFFLFFALSMSLSLCLLSLSLLFFFSFFFNASSRSVCSLHVYLLPLMFLLFVFIPFFDFFESLLFIFRFFVEKSLPFELFISLCKTFLVLSFFFVSSFFLIVFFDGVLPNKIKFTFFLWKQKPLI